MAITAGIATAFKQALLGGTYDTADDLKIALYASTANLGPSTATYTATGEASGAGYTAGGKSLSGKVTGGAGEAVWLDFADISWDSATITARGALIYNASKSNAAVAVLDFGADISSSGASFTVEFPAADADNAIIVIE